MVQGNAKTFPIRFNLKMNYLPETLSEYSRDFSEELPIESFLQYGFYKIADADLKPEERFIKNPEVNPIQYNVVKGLEDKYKSYRELIYACLLYTSPSPRD